jgi:hypothetical protein
VSACALGNQRYGTPWTITTTNDCWVGIGVMFVSLVGLMLFTSSLLGTLREAGFLRPSPRPHSDSAMRQEGRKDDDQVTHDREGCGRCGGAIGPRHGYVFATPAGLALYCTRCAVHHHPIVRKAMQTALVVGTILTAINQTDALLTHHVTVALLWKIPLTYVVPYLVSTYGALSISRQRLQQSRR